MNKKFFAPLLMVCVLVLLLLSPLAIAQKGNKKGGGGGGQGGSGCPTCDNGNCGSCSSKGFSACLNSLDPQACWQQYYQDNCVAKWGCSGDINPF